MNHPSEIQQSFLWMRRNSAYLKEGVSVGSTFNNQNTIH